MAFVPQAHPISYPYSVLDLVTMGRVRFMGALSIPSKRDKQLAQEALVSVGMQDYAGRACTQLSGGQMQMVFIARALAAQPEMLIMDEPESHLDFVNQHHVLELVERLKAEQNISCIINTHYPNHALRISDNVLMLGRDSYLYGSAETVITAENIAKYFGVNAEISRIERNGKQYESFVEKADVEKAQLQPCWQKNLLPEAERYWFLTATNRITDCSFNWEWNCRKAL